MNLNERMMHVFNMVDSPVGSERQGHAKGMHGPLLLKQSKIDDKIKTLFKSIYFKIFTYLFLPYHSVCGILFLRPEIELLPPALEVWRLNRRTTKEAPKIKTLDGPKSLLLLGGRL